MLLLVACDGERPPDVEREPEILAGLPEDAKRRILAEAGAHPVREIELTRANGATVYRASWLEAGKEISFEVVIRENDE